MQMCKCGPAAYDFGAKSRAHFLDLVRIFEKLLFAHVHIWTYRYPPETLVHHLVVGFMSLQIKFTEVAWMAMKERLVVVFVLKLT